ncbi:MAG: efflux RND transporter periplasmic adaptor subunit [Sedimentisphaerales bacterium]
MKKRRTWIIITIVVVLVLLVIGGLAAKSYKGKAKEEVVRIEEVKRGDLTERVSATGEIEPKEMVQISAKVSARIIDMPYDEGNVVTCGDPNANPPIPASVLVKLDAKDLESQLKLAEASRSAEEAQVEVERSRIEGSKANLVALAATLEQSQKDLERKKGLFESRDISKADFDLIKYKVDELAGQYLSAKYNLEASEKNITVLKHNLDAAEARIEEAKEYYSYTTITSPINGVVTRVNAKVGEMVMTGTMNNPGTVIMEVSDRSKMLVVAQVDEADIGALEVGQKAIVSVQAFPNVKFRGAVDEIALKHRFSNNGTRYYRTEILLDNDSNVSKLYTGLTADIDIETRKHPDVITVPSQAILAREVDSLPVDIRDKSAELDKGKKFATVVYRFIDGKAVATPVQARQSDLTHTIVLAGLKEGDKVVVGPYKVLDNLKQDQKLKDERETAKGKSKNKNGKSDSNESAGR